MKFDKETAEWFEKHPTLATTVEKCPFCQLLFRPSLGHTCTSQRKKIDFREMEKEKTLDWLYRLRNRLNNQEGIDLLPLGWVEPILKALEYAIQVVKSKPAGDPVDRKDVVEWLTKWEGYIDDDIIARMQYRTIDIPSEKKKKKEAEDGNKNIDN